MSRRFTNDLQGASATPRRPFSLIAQFTPFPSGEALLSFPVLQNNSV
jgi:hypothetical protein